MLQFAYHYYVVVIVELCFTLDYYYCESIVIRVLRKSMSLVLYSRQPSSATLHAAYQHYLASKTVKENDWAPELYSTGMLQVLFAAKGTSTEGKQKHKGYS